MSRRGWLIVIGGITAVIVALWVFPNRRIVNEHPSGTNVIAFGDSLTRGTGAPPGKDYPSRLSQMAGVPIVNAGVPGETSADAIRRVQRDVLQRDPRIVIVLLGGNDMLQRISHDQTAANVRRIVREIQQSGALVLLVGIDGPMLMGGLNSELKRVAHDEGAVFVSDILDGIIDNPRLKSDEVHPNAAGYEMMAERIYRVLRRYLKQ